VAPMRGGVGFRVYPGLTSWANICRLLRGLSSGRWTRAHVSPDRERLVCSEFPRVREEVISRKDLCCGGAHAGRVVARAYPGLTPRANVCRPLRGLSSGCWTLAHVSPDRERPVCSEFPRVREEAITMRGGVVARAYPGLRPGPTCVVPPGLGSANRIRISRFAKLGMGTPWHHRREDSPGVELFRRAEAASFSTREALDKPHKSRHFIYYCTYIMTLTKRSGRNTCA